MVIVVLQYRRHSPAHCRMRFSELVELPSLPDNADGAGT